MKFLPISLTLILLNLAFEPTYAQHHPGETCISCHSTMGLGGTVFSSYDEKRIQESVSLFLVRSDGSRITLPASDSSGRVYANTIADGTYLPGLGAIRSRTWHSLPAQRDCNSCHIKGGNGSPVRSKSLPKFHTEIPPDNDCKHCHFFPASMNIGMLKTPGQLNGSVALLAVQGSNVIIQGTSYPFKPEDHEIKALRSDIFTDGFYSMFDVILAVAKKNGISIEYHWSDSCKTHFIDKVNGISGAYWYHFSYDAGSGTNNELQYRRENRWDELLYQPGSWVQLVSGENVEELRREFKEEIERERQFGHMIPTVQITINPSNYKGNPSESGRISVQKTFTNVSVTSHDIRRYGRDSLYRMPYKPGIVTAMDVLYSLVDAGELTMVGKAYYTRLAGKVMESYRIREIGFPGIGSAHASGSQGFVYTTANGIPNRFANNADRKLHVHADVLVIHAPDFAQWRWAELGNPYYEQNEPTGIREMEEDYNARDKGFRLQLPYPQPAHSSVYLSCNIFNPGYYRIDVTDIAGRHINTLLDGEIDSIGIHTLQWDAGLAAPGVYFIRMTNGASLDIQRVQITK